MYSTQTLYEIENGKKHDSIESRLLLSHIIHLIFSFQSKVCESRKIENEKASNDHWHFLRGGTFECQWLFSICAKYGCA